MKFIKEIKDFLKQALAKNKLFLKKDFLRLFTVYATVNFCFIIGWTVIQRSFQQAAQLELKPLYPSPTPAGVDWSMIVLAVAILPISLFFEELAFRVLPYQIMRLLGLIKRSGKWFVVSFILVSGLWHTLLHQLNIVSATSIGMWSYFTIQSFAGFFYAYVYLKKGLLATYTIHVFWDLFLVGLSILLIFLRMSL